MSSVSPVNGAFQRLGVLPDGSGVVFELTLQFALVPRPISGPLEEGVFFVRADGSGLRRLGPAARIPVFHRTYDPRGPLGVSLHPTGSVFPVSPNGRTIAFLDFGPATAGHEAPQIFLLDLRTGRRRQLTHQPLVATGGDPGISFPSFRDNRTVVFGAGLADQGTFKTLQIKTDGSGLKEIPPPTLTEGARIVPQFAVFSGRRSYVALANLPDKQPVNPPPDHTVELFLVDGKDLVQLTDFGRSDTGGLAGTGFITRDRVLFLASANPTGENPGGICQFFSVNRRGGDLRQLTHLPADRPFDSCIPGFAGACTVDLPLQAPDEATGTVLFASSCDPVGGNQYGSQLFAMRSDGTGLRQLTTTRGMTTDPDGTVRVEMPGPFAHPVGRP